LTQYTLGLTRRGGHGRAFSQVLSPATPAVASGFTYTNDGLYWEYIDSVSFKIVTDSNAANRAVTLTVKDGTGAALATVPTAAALTASKTGLFSYLENYSAITGATDGPFLGPMPGVWLQPQFSIVVAIGGVQVGDQLSAIRIYAQRFVTGDSGYLLGVVDIDDPALNDALVFDAVRS
jgi:hypothetical protein